MDFSGKCFIVISILKGSPAVALRSLQDRGFPHWCSGGVPVVFAALDHRLMAAIPLGSIFISSGPRAIAKNIFGKRWIYYRPLLKGVVIYALLQHACKACFRCKTSCVLRFSIMLRPAFVGVGKKTGFKSPSVLTGRTSLVSQNPSFAKPWNR